MKYWTEPALCAAGARRSAPRRRSRRPRLHPPWPGRRSLLELKALQQGGEFGLPHLPSLPGAIAHQDDDPARMAGHDAQDDVTLAAFGVGNVQLGDVPLDGADSRVAVFVDPVLVLEHLERGLGIAF